MKNIFESVKNKFQLHLSYDTLEGNLEHQIKKVNQQIKRRDLLEYGAILFVFTTFLYVMMTGSNSVFQTIGIILILLSCFIVSYMLFKNRSRTSDTNYTLPLNEFLQKQKYFLENQIKLLNNVVYWYLGLPSIGLVLLQIDGGVFDLHKIIYLLIVTLLFSTIIALNKKAAKSLEPFLEKINISLDELSEDESEAN